MKSFPVLILWPLQSLAPCLSFLWRFRSRDCIEDVLVWVGQLQSHLFSVFWPIVNHCNSVYLLQKELLWWDVRVPVICGHRDKYLGNSWHYIGLQRKKQLLSTDLEGKDLQGNIYPSQLVCDLYWIVSSITPLNGELNITLPLFLFHAQSTFLIIICVLL